MTGEKLSRAATRDRWNLWIGILFFFVFIQKSSSQQYWRPLNSPTNQLLRTVSFVDGTTGWAAGDGGTILHTSDGGTNWVVEYSAPDLVMADIFFLNENIGWAISWDISTLPFRTLVFRTVNGGSHWSSQVYPVEDVIFRTIFFHDSLNGWMGGVGGALVYTSNGGNTWTPATIDSTTFSQLPILNFSFYSRKYAFACGGRFDLAGIIWKTTDYGQNWTASVVAPEPIQQLHLFDSLHAVGVGGDFEFGSGVVKTSDGGQTWHYFSLQVFGVASALSFRTGSEGWAPLGSAEKFIVTTDSGATWNDVPTPNHSRMVDLQFADSLSGYAVGENGVILKFNQFLVQVPLLLFPLNGATGISITPQLIWKKLDNAQFYHLQVSPQPDFSVLITDEQRLTDTSFVASGLASFTTYYWRVQAINQTGNSRWSTVWNFTTQPSVKIESSQPIPVSCFELRQNYPNPFNLSTTFAFDLPAAGRVSLEIFNLSGEVVETMVNGYLSPGRYTLHWNAGQVASGVYVYRMRFANLTRTRKFIILR